MNLIMDGLLVTGSFFAGIYCWILSGRVRDLKALDKGLGGSIVTLTRQIELARATLDDAQTGSREHRNELTQLIARADASASKLRLLIAAVGTPDSSPDVAIVGGGVTAPVAPPPPTEPAVAPQVAQIASLRPVADAPRPMRPSPPDVPKPRPIKLENILRRRGELVARNETLRSEDDILEALSAIAGGGR